MNWKTSVQELTSVLENLSVTNSSGQELCVDDAFSQLCDWVTACQGKKQRVYFVGNGASASMASHFSTDLAKNAHVPTEVFTDCSLVTATGNDFGYEHVFSYPLSQRMVADEILIAISSSGNSPNVVEAVKMAKKLLGKTVTVTAMSPDNAMKSHGDLNFYLPANTYSLAESGHAALLHHLIDRFSFKD
jgi:Phosphoheptose isomerase